jgi:hypothetical protein
MNTCLTGGSPPVVGVVVGVVVVVVEPEAGVCGDVAGELGAADELFEVPPLLDEPPALFPPPEVVAAAGGGVTDTYTAAGDPSGLATPDPTTEPTSAPKPSIPITAAAAERVVGTHAPSHGGQAPTSS